MSGVKKHNRVLTERGIRNKSAEKVREGKGEGARARAQERDREGERESERASVVGEIGGSSPMK